MSNESENKRIDLTQFDGIMEGPWELRTRPHGRNGMERRPEPNYNSTDVQKRLQAFTLTTTFAQQMSMCGYPHHSSIHFPASFDDADWLRVSLATARALAAAPDLIAELKRSYEELDEYDKLVGLLIENHFVETSPYETVKHLIETHQDYKASE